MSYEEGVRLVSQVGFPIVVAGYLLVRMEWTLRDLVAKIERLVAAVEGREGTRGR